MARPPKCRSICSMPLVKEFGPLDFESTEIIILNIDEYEVLRQLDYAHFTQEKCASRMNVSRTTVTRMYESARTKIAKQLLPAKKLLLKAEMYSYAVVQKPNVPMNHYAVIVSIVIINKGGYKYG